MIKETLDQLFATKEQTDKIIEMRAKIQNAKNVIEETLGFLEGEDLKEVPSEISASLQKSLDALKTANQSLDKEKELINYGSPLS